jgi:WD40 repeat protein
MSTAAIPFYVTGGALRQDAPSYVERQADRELYDGLARGEFCYVLTSRQMGKSSLRVRTTARLREAGVAVVNLDLTALGQNLTVEQWYDGLLHHVGRQLDLEEELEEYWLAHERQSPLQRWLGALQQVMLVRVPGRVVIFIDEIDAVRSLPFSTDEFFAAIRECYQRRTQDPEYERLTFCLLGVATPSDLIQDTRTTPFNIGRRIELSDFTAAEAVPLAGGLGCDAQTAQTLLQRVLYWTGGHPYLTQRLCQAVAEEASLTHPGGVDRLCEELFLSQRARQRDDNLLFVRERLLKSEVERAGLLDLYARVRQGKRVPDDETSQLTDVLRLSGIVRVVDGSLRVRNRIYERIFDRAWIGTHMPDVELRRQRTAYLRGLWRALGVSLIILAVVGSLALTAENQARRATHQQHVADRQRRRAEERERTARQYLYVARMNLAQQTAEGGDADRALALLDAQRPEPGQEELRGFEWRYLWRLCQGTTGRALRGHTGILSAVAFSPDGKILASGSEDGTIKLWEVATGRQIVSLTAHAGVVGDVAFSPHGKLLASAGGDRTVKLWDVAVLPERPRQIATLRGHTAGVMTVMFSPDGRTLASASPSGGTNRFGPGEVKLWNVGSRREIATLKEYLAGRLSLAFSPDGKLLATGGADGRIHLRAVASRREVALLAGPTATGSLAFSPDGKILAVSSEDGAVRLWAVRPKQVVGTLWGQGEWNPEMAFSPDGSTLAVGASGSVKLWDLTTRQKLTELRGHRGRVSCVQFSPDGKTLASGGHDTTVRLWTAGPRGGTATRSADRWASGSEDAEEDSTTVIRQSASIAAMALSPDGKALATASGDRTVRLWDIASRRELATLKGHTAAITGVAFASDGRTLASTSNDKTVKLWNIASRQEIGTLRGHTVAITAVAFAPNGTMLTTAAGAGPNQPRPAEVKLWDLATRRAVDFLDAQQRMVYQVAFSPDGKTLATQSVDTMASTVRLWDLAARRVSAVLEGQLRYPLVFSPDGRTLTTSSGSGIKLWDTNSRRLVATLKGEDGAVAFSPDGNTLAIANANTIRLWNLAMRQQVATLTGHAAVVKAVAFTPDGNTLVSASSDGTMRLWHAATFPETDPLRVVWTAASDRKVMLQWQPVPYAIAYNVYRRSGVPASTPGERAHWRKLTAAAVAGPTFIDQAPDLVNGRTETYGVAAVYREQARSGARSGKLREGPRVTLPATPVALPPGFQGCSINESPRSGLALFDAATGRITLRGSGKEIWFFADGFYFLCRPVTGDFQATVKALTTPVETNEWARAGLMLRDSLEPGARNAYLHTTAAHGLIYHWRSVADDATESIGVIKSVSGRTRLKVPIVLRLTRQGEVLTMEYSRDDGKSFQKAYAPYQFQPALPRSVYVGLAISAQNAGLVTEAKFSGLEIRKR